MPDDAVTCLMVTRGDAVRHSRIRASLASYAAQTVEKKHLLILCGADRDADWTALRDLVDASGRSDVELVRVSGDLTLGASRNRSTAMAKSEYLAQWDDDDLYHPSRLANQLAALQGSGQPSCYLEDNYQLVEARRALYWTNWARTPARVHPGSGLWHRSTLPRYPETGGEAARGEDLAAVLDLSGRGAVHALQGCPHLFVYVTHGDNVWAMEHHAMLAERLSLSSALLRRREASIRAGLAPFGFSGITVQGSNGSAFELGPGHG